MNAIPGCLVTSFKKFCGPTVLDTGSPGIGMVTKEDSDFDQAKAARTYQLVLGDGGQAQALAFSAPPFYRFTGPNFPAALGTVLVPGLPIIKDLAISYDPAHATIGIKPRPGAEASLSSGG
jgi:hypothetical protein